MKLRTKILLLLIPLIVTPMLAMGWIAYSELNEKSKQKAFAEMWTSIDHLAGHLGLDVETAAANIELFANHTLIEKYILTGDEEERYALLQGPTLRALRSFQQAFPRYYEIRILLPDGYEDIRRTTSPPLDNRTEEEDQNPLFIAMRQAGDSVSSMIFRNPDNGVAQRRLLNLMHNQRTEQNFRGVLRLPAFLALGERLQILMHQPQD